MRTFEIAPHPGSFETVIIEAEDFDLAGSALLLTIEERVIAAFSQFSWIRELRTGQ